MRHTTTAPTLSTLVKLKQKPKRHLIIFYQLCEFLSTFYRLVIILFTNDGFCQLSAWQSVEIFHHTAVCLVAVTVTLLALNIGKVWLKSVDDSRTSKKKSGAGGEGAVPKRSPNVSKFVFTESWGLSRTLIIISWVCFLDELFPHAVSSHNERSLFLLCLHHNDGSFFLCELLVSHHMQGSLAPSVFLRCQSPTRSFPPLPPSLTLSV